MADSFPVLEVPAGSSLARDLQARDYLGQRRTGVYLDTDVLSAVIWPAGAPPEAALAVAPAVSWIDGATGAAAGLWRLQLHSADTTALGPGRYRVRVNAVRGSDSDTLLEADLVVTGVGGAPGLPAAPAVAGPDAAALGLVATLYCTDEQIAVRCGPDFAALCPESQLVARGSDGSFAAADPWTLTSPSNDFGVQGVAVGSVVHLRRPTAAFGGSGVLLGVAAIAGTSVTLRRLGLPAARGLAPAPAAGIAGVEFAVATFAPQIEEATYDLNQRYTIDAARAGRSPAGLADVRQLRRACVAMVLIDRYSDMSRPVQGEYAAKLAALKDELGELQAKLALRWSLSPLAGEAAVSTWFSTRVVR